MPRPDTQHWLDKAGIDEAAFVLLKSHSHWETATFHAQQAAEKLLKAALVEHGIVPNRTHDLEDLLVAHPIYIPNQVLSDACDRLTPAAVTGRYPGMHSASEQDAIQAELDLVLIKSWALTLIP